MLGADLSMTNYLRVVFGLERCQMLLLQIEGLLQDGDFLITLIDHFFEQVAFPFEVGVHGGDR